MSKSDLENITGKLSEYETYQYQQNCLEKLFKKDPSLPWHYGSIEYRDACLDAIYPPEKQAEFEEKWGKNWRSVEGLLAPPHQKERDDKEYEKQAKSKAFGMYWRTFSQIDENPYNKGQTVKLLQELYKEKGRGTGGIDKRIEGEEFDVFLRSARRDYRALGTDLGIFPKIDESTFADMQIPEDVQDEQAYRKNVYRLAIRIIFEEGVLDTALAWKIAQSMNKTAYTRRLNPKHEEVIRDLMETHIPQYHQTINANRMNINAQIKQNLMT